VSTAKAEREVGAGWAVQPSIRSPGHRVRLVQTPGVRHQAGVPELVGLSQGADRPHPSVEDVENSGPDDPAVPVAEDRSGWPFTSRGSREPLDPQQRPEDRVE
jgi:hypothetical protein